MPAPVKYEELKILPGLKNAIRVLSEAEERELFSLLDEYGVTDPIKYAWIDGSPVIIDGHNRSRWYFQGGHENHPEPPVKCFDNIHTIEDALILMIRWQLGKRNTTPQEASWLLGELLRVRVAQEFQKENPQSRGEIVRDIADEQEVSERTVQRGNQFRAAIEKFAELDAETAEEIKAGRTPASNRDVLEMSKLPTSQLVVALGNLKNGRQWDWEEPAPPAPPEDATPKKETARDRKVKKMSTRCETLKKTLIPQLLEQFLELSREMRQDFSFVKEASDQMYATILAWEPIGVCPDCKTGCKRCSKRGWLRKSETRGNRR